MNVTATPVLPVARSADAIVNDIEPTAPPITPDAIETEAAGSAFVCTVICELPMAVLPILRPASMTVTAVLAESAVPPVVMMMDVAPGAPGDRVEPLAETVAVGVAVVAKKPKG